MKIKRKIMPLSTQKSKARRGESRAALATLGRSECNDSPATDPALPWVLRLGPPRDSALRSSGLQAPQAALLPEDGAAPADGLSAERGGRFVEFRGGSAGECDLLAQLHPDDRKGFLCAVETSHADHAPLDWTGRFCPESVCERAAEATANQLVRIRMKNRRNVASSDRTSATRPASCVGDHWWRFVAAPATLPDGATHWSGTALDITELHESLLELRQSEARFRLFAESGEDVFSLHSSNGQVLYVSPSIEQLTGYSAEECVGQMPTRFAHPDDLVALKDIRRKRRRSAGVASSRITWRAIGKDGVSRWIETTYRLLPDGPHNPARILCTSRDVTRSRQREDENAWRATHDPLTGLPNRALFLDELERVLSVMRRTEGSLAVLFLDVDGFKRVNDLLGHATGDSLLVGVARLLCDQLRESDTIARLGGDEFIALLPHISAYAEPYQIAERLVETFRRPIEADGQEVFVTASIGVAVYPFDGTDAHALMRAADTAMYEAKGAGRNTYQMHTHAMHVATHDRMILESGLRRAIARNELSLDYQPLVSLRNGNVVGVEALLRWRHGRLGMVPCARFIPIAEESGLIRPLGEWVLRTACKQAAAWLRQRPYSKPDEVGSPRLHGAPISVAVNLSALQLGQPGIVEQVTSALEDAGLDPYFLELELTESALIWNGEGALKTLKAFKDLGIRLAVDDFGAGYSSLSYLRRFPFDAVKIDRSFVSDLADPQTLSIVRAVVDLAHALRLNVVAEGVERTDQRVALEALGCDAMQGWLFSPPVAAELVPALLA